MKSFEKMSCTRITHVIRSLTTDMLVSQTFQRRHTFVRVENLAS